MGDALPAGTTLGVEEEFLLVDPATGMTTPCAPAVLRRLDALPPPQAGIERKCELLTSQIEVVTAPCATLDELAAQLTAGRVRTAEECAAEGVALVSTGTPVLDGTRPPVTEGLRFREILGMYAEVVADYQVCGCHVHVGVPEREAAVAVVNRLRPWLPTLLALSANSPFRAGRDTGYASWRIMEQARFPGSGIPPRFASAAAHEDELERLVDCGVLADTRMSFWLARPSPRFATVEFRAADATGTVEESLLQAALSRALVRTALAEIRAGRDEPRLSDQVLAAAVWAAARYGVYGSAVDPWAGRSVPAGTMVGALLDHVGPQLEETGDLARVRELVREVMARGGGAGRQRAAARRGGPRAVVDHLARQTVPRPAAGRRLAPGRTALHEAARRRGRRPSAAGGRP